MKERLKKVLRFLLTASTIPFQIQSKTHLVCLRQNGVRLKWEFYGLTLAPNFCWSPDGRAVRDCLKDEFTGISDDYRTSDNQKIGIPIREALYFKESYHLKKGFAAVTMN